MKQMLKSKAQIIIWYLCFGIILNFALCHLSLAKERPRYISLAPSTTEILFALGLDSEIVGVSSFCNYPPEAQNKEKIGNFSQPNIEKIISLRPDYIFCTGLEQAQAIAELKRLNLNLYVADPKNIEELLLSIEEIAKITHRENDALALIKNIKGTIEEISLKVSRIPQNKRQKVFIEIWDKPLTTAGGGTFLDEMITFAGGINIANDTRRPYSTFSAEEVIRRNPDCIIFGYMDKEKPLLLVEARLGWNVISAVKNNRLYNDIDSDILLRPGPRVALAIKEIYHRLYPDEEQY